jgi:polysaccharide export outer membrane protein
MRDFSRNPAVACLFASLACLLFILPILGTEVELPTGSYGKENEQQTLQIDRNGAINIPKLGPVVAVQITFGDASADSARLSNRDWCRNNRRYGSIGVIRISMAGEVLVPES